MSRATAPMKAVSPLIAELEQETQIARRVLERVPGDKLTWKPHTSRCRLDNWLSMSPLFRGHWPAFWRSTFMRLEALISQGDFGGGIDSRPRGKRPYGTRVPHGIG